MQSEPGRYINSVSDLYGADEIEVLLEEIRDLEPASCRPEDIQDFEIAGSQTGVAAAGIDCESPAVTVRSWDSHANYRHQLPESSPTASLFSGVILYCDETHLKSSTGVVRVLLVFNKLATSFTASHSQGLAFPTVTLYHHCKIIYREISLSYCSVAILLQISSVACLACLCSSGTVKVGLFMLPLIGRLRLMMFVTVFSLLVTCLFIFLDISHIVYFFPFNWGKLNALFYVSVSVLYLIGSSLVIHLIHMYHESYSWVPKWTRDQLLVTGILGYLCALEALLLSIITRRSALKYSPVDEDPSQMTLQERQDRELQPMGGSRFPSSTSLQLQVPPSNQLPSSQQQKQQKQQQKERQQQQQQQKKQQIQQKQQKQQKWPAVASSSAPAPRVWPVDDVQPCSSKYPDPYMVA